MIDNIFSVDLESFSHRELDLLKRQHERRQETPRAVNLLLKLLKAYKIKTTFFVVAELADQYPELITKIKTDGHEIGYHTHRHTILRSSADLIRELKLSQKFLKRFRPIGFRAPRMFFRKEYFPILFKYGFKYDSSGYDCYDQGHIIAGVKEIPVSLFSLLPHLPLAFPKNFNRSLLKGIPFGSGMFIGLMGQQIQSLINWVNKKNQPAVIFIHPWQLLPGQGDLPGIGNLHRRWLYGNNVVLALEHLFSKNKFVPFREVL